MKFNTPFVFASLLFTCLFAAPVDRVDDTSNSAVNTISNMDKDKDKEPTLLSTRSDSDSDSKPQVDPENLFEVLVDDVGSFFTSLFHDLR